jgi:hypothetical protein
MRGAEQIYLQVAQDAPDIATELEKIQGVLTVHAQPEAGAYEVETTLNSDRRADIAATAVQRGWGVLELRPVRASLEDIFLELTTREDEEE